MAEIKGKDLIFAEPRPEERLAAKWVDRLELKFPFDIVEIVSRFANITVDKLPVAADAILYQTIDHSQRPEIFLSEELDRGRKSFTLAHELGHILIPWHTGSFACTPLDHNDRRYDYQSAEIYLNLESEANRFAAAFLIPNSHLIKLADQEREVISIIRALKNANISKIAASIRLIKTLPPGFMFFQIDQSDMIICQGKSTNTFWGSPVRGNSLDIDMLRAQGASVEIIDGSNPIVWADWRSVATSRSSLAPEEPSAKILKRILSDCGDEGNVGQRIAGIVGAAKNTAVKSNVDLYTVLVRRFEGRGFLNKITQHSDFRKFLLAKTSELESN